MTSVLEPLIFGRSLELAPVVILLSLMIWGMLWGLTGMVLAVPMTAILKIHLASIDHPVAIRFRTRHPCPHHGQRAALRHCHRLPLTPCHLCSQAAAYLVAMLIGANPDDTPDEPHTLQP